MMREPTEKAKRVGRVVSWSIVAAWTTLVVVLCYLGISLEAKVSLSVSSLAIYAYAFIAGEMVTDWFPNNG